MTQFKVVSLDQNNLYAWGQLRHLLWPDHGREKHVKEGIGIIKSKQLLSLLIVDDHDKYLGFADVSIRKDDVNGCAHSPVAFLEGIFVLEDFRRLGLAGLLLSEAEQWGRTKGCLEFASDTSLDNHVAQIIHQKLGFEITERVVFFKKNLDR